MLRDEPYQRLSHTFVSSAAQINIGGRFLFNFREPIRNVVAAKLKSCTIGNFATIGASYIYFLRTDCMYGSRDCGYFNGKPDKVVFSIPNCPAYNGQPISRTNTDEEFVQYYEGYIMGIWFEILDQNGQIINPPDVGWSFTVELELKINLLY